MLRDKVILKEQLNQFTKSELIGMLTKISSKGFNYEFLLINYLDPVHGEELLFDEAIIDLDQLLQKEFKGRTIQHQMAKNLKACTERIKAFTKETKDKKLEADLIFYVLSFQFEHNAQVFGAKHASYDYKVGLLVKKLIGLVTKQMHADYLLDYQDNINKMLVILHHTSDRINTIKSLPISID